MRWRAALGSAGVAAVAAGWLTVALARQMHAWARDNDLFAEQYARAPRPAPGWSVVRPA